jgi:hypothetical protein
MSLKIEYLSRWGGLDARGFLPNIFPDPEHPTEFAVVTLYEPPRELRESYIRGGDEAWRALKKFHAEAKAQGKEYKIHPLFRKMQEKRVEAAEKKRPLGMLLGEVLEQYKKRELWRLSEFIIHPWNTRVIPHNADGVLGNFEHLCKTGDLMHPLLVVPLSGKLRDIYVKTFEMIVEKIKARARSDERLQRVIKQEGIEEALRGITGYRKVTIEKGYLVFTEDDPIRKIAGTKYVKGFVLDGQRRIIAMWKDFVAGCNDGRYLPENDDVVTVDVVEELDPSTSMHLSIELNSGLMEANEGELTAFFNTNPLNKVLVEITAERFGKDAVVNKVSQLMIEYEVGVPSKDLPMTEVHGLLEPPQPRREVREEEEKREERRRERKEEPVRRADVSEVQRQFAPTYPYAPAQQQTTIQMPVSHPASAQSIREEAQRLGQTQPVQLNEISVLSVALDQYFARHNAQAHYYVFQGKGIDVRLDYNLKKVLENSGLSGRSNEVDIRYTGITDLPIKGMQLKARVYVPVAWGKYCSNCGHLIVLSPTRCVFCGEVISPLPYVVSYKPAGT